MVTDAEPQNNYFKPLTGIRAVAVCLVFLHHFNPFPERLFGRYIHAFVAEFHVGVTIFFVLSGFLICYRYYDTFSGSKKWLWKYFVNRFARIYPLYFLVTAVGFLPFICNCNFSEQWKLFLLNISFLRGFFDEYKFTGAPAGWSLTVEELFYFLFPLLILFSRKLKLIFWTLFFTGTGLLLWFVCRDINLHGFFISLQFLFEFTFFGRCFEFFTGVYLALLIKRNASLVTPKAGQGRTSAGIVSIALCIALLALNRHFSADQNMFLLFETLINNFILPVSIAFFFYGLITEQSVWNKILSTPLFGLLGKSSYVFYLIHNGFVFTFLYLALGLNIVFVFILLQCISVVLFLWLEKPLNNFIRRKAGIQEKFG